MQNILADIQYIPELVKTQWEVSELMNSTFVIWYVDISILNVELSHRYVYMFRQTYYFLIKLSFAFY